MLREIRLIKVRAGYAKDPSPKNRINGASTSVEFDEGAWEERLGRRGSGTLRVQKKIVEGLKKVKLEGLKKVKWEVKQEVKRIELDISLMQLVAACAMRSGIEPDDFLPYVRALRQLHKFGVISPGMDFTGLRRMVAENYPVLIDNFLLGKVEAASTHELIMKFCSDEFDTSGPVPKMLLNRFNLITNLLLLLGKIDRLPGNSRIGHNTAMWIHMTHRGTPASIPDWDTAYVITSELKKRSLAKMDLIDAPALRSIIAAKPSIITDKVWRTLDSDLDLLLEQGLITSKKGKGTFGSKPTIYSLTQKTIEFHNFIDENRYLPEEFNLALLGVKRSGLRPREEARLADIVKGIRVLMAIAKHPRASYETIGNLANASPTFVHTIKNTSSNPWSMISNKTLFSKYIPALQERRPKYAEWFMTHLNESDMQLPLLYGETAANPEPQDKTGKPKDPRKSDPGE